MRCGLVQEPLDAILQRCAVSVRVRLNVLEAMLRELLDEHTIAPLDAEIMRFLSSSSSPASTLVVARALARPPAVVKMHLRRLAEPGLVRRQGRCWAICWTSSNCGYPLPANLHCDRRGLDDLLEEALDRFRTRKKVV